MREVQHKGDYHMLLSVNDKSNGHKVIKEIEDVNEVIDRVHLMDIHRTLYFLLFSHKHYELFYLLGSGKYIILEKTLPTPAWFWKGVAVIESLLADNNDRHVAQANQ